MDAVFLGVLVSSLLALACYLLSQGPSLGPQDFRAFYTAGQMVRQSPAQLFNVDLQRQWQQTVSGGTLVLPYYHAAFEALLYVPFALLDFKAAYLAYAAWNIFLLWVCYAVSPSGCTAFSQAGRPLLFFLSFPLLYCIFIGQNSMLLLLALCLTYTAIGKGRDVTAGLLLGLLTFKLAIVVPLAFFLCLRRGWRFLAGFALTSAATLGLPILLTGVAATREFVRLLGKASLATNHSISSQIESAALPQTMPNLSGLLYLCGSRHLSAHAAFALNLAVMLPLVLACVYIQRRAKQESIAFSAAVVITVLISPHLNVYDLSTLVLPLLLLSHRWLRYAAVLWFVVPLVLYAIGGPIWFAPAVMIPLALLAVCIAEFRSESHELACRTMTPAYGHGG
jgi:hypothetical protein